MVSSAPIRVKAVKANTFCILEKLSFFCRPHSKAIVLPIESQKAQRQRRFARSDFGLLFSGLSAVGWFLNQMLNGSTAQLFCCQDRVVQKHGDGHRAHTAGYGREVGRHFAYAKEVDVAT